MTESSEPTRELEFLDVYNDTQPHKITYSIEHMSGPPNGGDFILTENSGTFTLTQNTKLENTSSHGSDKIDDGGDVEEEDDGDDDDNDADADADADADPDDDDDDDEPDVADSIDADGTEADEAHIIDDFSNSGGDPLIELAATAAELEEPIIHQNGQYVTATTPTSAGSGAGTVVLGNNSGTPGSTAATTTTAMAGGTTVIHIKPKIKNLKLKPRQQSTLNRQHAQLQRALENTLESHTATDPISILKTSSNDSYHSVGEIHQLHENAIDLAVQAVITEGMSLQKAAQKFVISKTVLWRRVRKHPNYMKTSRENPVLKLAYERLREGDSLKNISRDLDIPMSTLHRHKVRLAQQGRLPKYVTFKKRDSMTKDELKEKLSKAVHACVHDGMSQNKSANLYDIPKSTLWRHLQKRVAEAELSKRRNTVEIKEEIILS